VREIKFRGLDKHGKWAIGSLVVTTNFIKKMPQLHTKNWIVETAFGNGGWFNVQRRVHVIDKTVGQYTELRDSKRNYDFNLGEMLFDGDIVKATIDDKKNPEYHCWKNPIKHEVIWTLENVKHNMYSGFKFYGIDRRFNTPATLNLIYGCKIEKIGNIHQNPELLEKKS
jgi:hypothetical protein